MARASEDLEKGRHAYARRAWRDANVHLGAADRVAELGFEDLVRFACSAYLIGQADESVEILTRAHREAADASRAEQAVRAAFWIFFLLVNRGEMAQAGGWFMRGQRLAEGLEPRCAEAGFMMLPPALQRMFGGDAAGALPLFDRAIEVAKECGDPDLLTLTRMGRAQTLVNLGRTGEGVAQLDEAMVAATSDRVLPIVTGLAYCAVIDACQRAFDLRRADEWTRRLSRWCSEQPDLVPYRGQCLVHRAEVMQLKGSWAEAMQEAEKARDQLLHAPDVVAVGKAFYQLGEVHRLLGDFDKAESAYREANQWGHPPQPGLTRLRLAQGDLESARAAVDRLLQEAREPYERGALLPTYVDVMVATGDLGAARRGTDSLTALADEFDAPFVTALAAAARGTVLLAEGEPMEALLELRQAWEIWRELSVPYEAARVRVPIGVACREIGDEDGAQMELDAARWAFEQLGALPDVERVDELLRPAPASPAEGLTGREVEVLALVATGKTNREVAEGLFISEKTVARHLSNIFVKLGISSRAAATAYAYEHDLV